MKYFNLLLILIASLFIMNTVQAAQNNTGYVSYELKKPLPPALKVILTKNCPMIEDIGNKRLLINASTKPSKQCIELGSKLSSYLDSNKILKSKPELFGCKHHFFHSHGYCVIHNPKCCW